MKHTILFYGIALAILIFLMKWLEYNYLVHELSTEFYIGIIAVFFTGLGIWAGLKLTQKKIIVTSPHFVLNESQLQKLGISKREHEVLRLMAQGLSNQEIADKLFVSLNTIKTHTSNLFLKLEASRRTEAVRKAKDMSLIP
jgi:DNA-binding CsgD family transcriptional regulator